MSAIERQHEVGMLSASDSMDFSDSMFSSGEEDTPSSGYSSTSSVDQRPSAATYAYNKSNYEVLRLDSSGRTRKFFVRRRDLLKEYRLQPRDLRRIDPSIDFTKTSPSITIKENVLLLCLGGVRAIVTEEKALLFEPGNLATRRLVDTIVPHLQHKAAEQGGSPSYTRNNNNNNSSGGNGSNGNGGGGGGGGSGMFGALAAVGSGGIGVAHVDSQNRMLAGASHTDYMARYYAKTNNDQGVVRSPPFELELLEGALIGATGRLDAELASVTGRVQDLLTRLPVDINPVSLEELRRVKASLVELEDKADNLRETLEELMDDEDELRELNLSSRPRREERRRQRERDRLERELERAREIKEELEGRLEEDESSGGGGGNLGAIKMPGGRGGTARGAQHGGAQAPSSGPGSPHPSPSSLGLNIQGLPSSPAHYVDASGEGYASWTGGDRGGGAAAGSPAPTSLQGENRTQRIAELRAKFDRERLADLRAKFSWSGGGGGGGGAEGAEGNAFAGSWSNGVGGGGGRRSSPVAVRDREAERAERMERLRIARGNSEGADADWISRLEQQLEGSEEDIQEAQEALEEMVEAEEEEQEVEEVEDLLEYYLQRSTATQSEAERLLEGARDLEESIGISLSARRYEVNRLELTLSIGSFAAALGAMIAGIFGMNMKSMLELSIAGFWGIAAAIVVGCAWVFVAIMKYTQSKRIL